MARERARQRQQILLRNSGVTPRVAGQSSILTDPAPKRRRHVLIVEDSSLVADALRLLLEEQGYEVTAADSIESARRAAAQRPPDIVFLDLGLPDGDGLELAREWAQSQSAVVLALTGYADEATRTRCLESGCRAVLVKPAPISEMLRQLDALQTEEPGSS